MNAPLVTVCIPVYNGHAFLDRCLQAIVKQTYDNLDILVVDNQSTDDSAALLAGWAGRDPRIRVVTNDANIGLVPNRNRCIELARGEWIKFMDVDDVLAPPPSSGCSRRRAASTAWPSAGASSFMRASTRPSGP